MQCPVINSCHHLERAKEQNRLTWPIQGLPWASSVFLAVQLVHTFKMTNYQAVTLTDGNRCFSIPAVFHPSFSIHLSLPPILQFASIKVRLVIQSFLSALFFSRPAVRLTTSFPFLILVVLYSSSFAYCGHS